MLNLEYVLSMFQKFFQSQPQRSCAKKVLIKKCVYFQIKRKIWSLSCVSLLKNCRMAMIRQVHVAHQNPSYSMKTSNKKVSTVGE